jgi:hypothetical protein
VAVLPDAELPFWRAEEGRAVGSEGRGPGGAVRLGRFDRADSSKYRRNIQFRVPATHRMEQRPRDALMRECTVICPTPMCNTSFTGCFVSDKQCCSNVQNILVKSGAKSTGDSLTQQSGAGHGCAGVPDVHFGA